MAGRKSTAPEISRRDFLNGVALSVAAGLAPRELFAARRYPPALTGMRGNHPGSFEAAHQLAWNQARPPRPAEQTDATYDLVIIGGGLSGLAAAFLYQQRHGGRVLVLDNHDDFGGHAKRNEFSVGGQRLIGYGGSQSIDSPATYSPEARQILADVGVRTEPFYDYFDRGYFERRGLKPTIFFEAERYGENRLVLNALGDYRGAPDPDEAAAAISAYPISDAAKGSFRELLDYQADPFDDLDNAAKIAKLRGMTYSAYLAEVLGVHDEVVGILRDKIKGLWGVGWDSLSALEAWRSGEPGTAGLRIEEHAAGDGHGAEPYIFHFPDGNAGVARALVGRLVPEAFPARTMEAQVLADVDYSLLDVKGAPTRVRLNALALDLRNTADGRHVDVTYVRDGRAERVRGRHAIMAGYLHMLPYLCPEVGAEQKAAIGYAEKVPLVYLSLAVRNWRAFAELGTHSIYVPQSDFMHSFGLDFPVSMGGYEFTRSPDTPTVVHGSFIPAAPGLGLSAREQHVAGRARIYDMRYEDFERLIVRQLDGAVGGGGFDVERDLAAITVNRWPHGYAYEYNDFFDPPDYGPQKGPHIRARERLGRISIANSDAAAFAYVDGAFDSAHRAVTEVLGEKKPA